MAFFEDIRNYLPITDDVVPIQLVGEEYVVITGLKSIKLYTNEKITFLMKKKRLNVIGEDLKINFLSNHEAFVKGVIKSVEFER